MQTTMLWRCGVFSTATRWSPTRLTWPSVLTAAVASSQQGLLEGRICPGLGDNLRAVMRADLGLVSLDDGIQRSRIDIAFLGQDRLQRAHAQLGLRQFGMVVIVVVSGVVIVIMVAHGVRIGAKSGLCRGRDSASICRWGSGQGAPAIAVAVAILAWLPAGEARAANGAYAVDAADIGEAGSCKVESWLSSASNTDFTAVANPSCVVNPFQACRVEHVHQPCAQRWRMEHHDPAEGQDEYCTDRRRQARVFRFTPAAPSMR